MRDEFAGILRDGVTVLLVTHEQEEAFSLADRVAVMRDVAIVQAGVPEEIYYAPATRWAAEFVGAANVLPGRLADGLVETLVGRFPAPNGDGPGDVEVLVRPELLALNPTRRERERSSPASSAATTSSTVCGWPTDDCPLRSGPPTSRSRSAPAWPCGRTSAVSPSSTALPSPRSPRRGGGRGRRARLSSASTSSSGSWKAAPTPGSCSAARGSSSWSGTRRCSSFSSPERRWRSAVPLAWLVTRTDLPGAGSGRSQPPSRSSSPATWPRSCCSPRSARGFLQQVLEGPFGIERVPEIYGLPGAVLALTISTYPYVYLLAAAALRDLDPALEEASRSLGAARGDLPARHAPVLRPSLGAGALLVALYTLSDFGAVSLMQYNSLTRAIYVQYRSPFDRTPAAALALVLVVLTAIVLLLEYRARARPVPPPLAGHGASAAARPARLAGAGPPWPSVAASSALRSSSRSP